MEKITQSGIGLIDSQKRTYQLVLFDPTKEQITHARSTFPKDAKVMEYMKHKNCTYLLDEWIRKHVIPKREEDQQPLFDINLENSEEDEDETASMVYHGNRFVSEKIDALFFQDLEKNLMWGGSGKTCWFKVKLPRIQHKKKPLNPKQGRVTYPTPMTSSGSIYFYDKQLRATCRHLVIPKDPQDSTRGSIKKIKRRQTKTAYVLLEFHVTKED
jgi:hypothetical protein